MPLSKFSFNDLPKIFHFPNKSELEKLSSKYFYKNDNSLEEIIIFIRTLLSPLFRLIMPSNIASGKITYIQVVVFLFMKLKNGYVQVLHIHIFLKNKEEKAKRNIIFLS